MKRLTSSALSPVGVIVSVRVDFNVSPAVYTMPPVSDEENHQGARGVESERDGVVQNRSLQEKASG